VKVVVPLCARRSAVAALVVFALPLLGLPGAQAAVPAGGRKFLIRTTFLEGRHRGEVLCVTSTGNLGPPWFTLEPCDPRTVEQLFARSPDGSEVRSLADGRCIEDTDAKVLEVGCGAGYGKNRPLVWVQDAQGHVHRPLPDGSAQWWIEGQASYGLTELTIQTFDPGESHVANVWTFQLA
jgi:hypothetical protein